MADRAPIRTSLVPFLVVWRASRMLKMGAFSSCLFAYLAASGDGLKL